MSTNVELPFVFIYKLAGLLLNELNVILMRLFVYSGEE